MKALFVDCYLGLAWFYINFAFSEVFKVFLFHYKGGSWGTHSLKLKEMVKGLLGENISVYIIVSLVICKVSLLLPRLWGPGKTPTKLHRVDKCQLNSLRRGPLSYSLSTTRTGAWLLVRRLLLLT